MPAPAVQMARTSAAQAGVVPISEILKHVEKHIQANVLKTKRIQSAISGKVIDSSIGPFDFGSDAWAYYTDEGISPTWHLTAAISTDTNSKTRFTTSNPYSFNVGQFVKIAGVTPPGYNGNFTVTDTPSSTTFKVAFDSSALTYTSGGSVSAPRFNSGAYLPVALGITTTCTYDVYGEPIPGALGPEDGRNNLLALYGSKNQKCVTGIFYNPDPDNPYGHRVAQIIVGGVQHYTYARPVPAVIAVHTEGSAAGHAYDDETQATTLVGDLWGNFTIAGAVRPSPATPDPIAKGYRFRLNKTQPNANKWNDTQTFQGGNPTTTAATGTGHPNIRLTPQTFTGAPGSNTHDPGEMVMDAVFDIYVCIAAGTPGTWKKVSLI